MPGNQGSAGPCPAIDANTKHLPGIARHNEEQPGIAR